MTTNLFVFANVKQLRTGGSFRILLSYVSNIGERKKGGRKQKDFYKTYISHGVSKRSAAVRGLRCLRGTGSTTVHVQLTEPLCS